MTSITKNNEYLRLLSIFHYVLAVITALFACFPLVHLVLGISMIINPEWFSSQNGHANPENIEPVIGWIFTAVASILIVLGWIFAVCIAMAGRFLSKKKNLLYCMIIAGLECLFVPLGTILGIFTLILLVQDDVKAVFAESE